MIANYHTHTPLCRHAEGEPMEYAQSALNAGLQILGFSDHTPYWFPEGYYTHMRMYPGQLAGYVRAIEEVRQAFAGRLQIHVGLETEYYPGFWKETLPKLQDAGIEYMLLGQHWIGDEMGEPYSGRPTSDETRLKRYCHQVMDAMHTGVFTYLAHPDLLNFTGSTKVYDLHMRRMCREAKECGMPLEINLWGMYQKKNYPDKRFWKIAGEEGCPVIIGCDAHEPWAVPNEPMLKQALELVKKWDLQLMDTVPLRSIV